MRRFDPRSAGADVELIAVDDASPDHAPRAARRARGGRPAHARRAPRRASRRGPPRATSRSARATGDYVWFVDATDLLPGRRRSPAVARALRRDRAPTCWSSTTRARRRARARPAPGPHRRRARARAAEQSPGRSTERPGLADPRPAACNKVLAARTCEATGARFGRRPRRARRDLAGAARRRADRRARPTAGYVRRRPANATPPRAARRWTCSPQSTPCSPSSPPIPSSRRAAHG